MPPFPDIFCIDNNDNPISIELVQIIEQNFARKFGSQIKTKKEIDAFYSSLSRDEKELIRGRLYNAFIAFEFNDEATLRQRKKMLPELFNVLKNITTSFEGELKLSDPTFRNICEILTISRGRFTGPLFDINLGGFVEDPVIKSIEGKLKKTYQKDSPMHLLAYIDLNPMFPQDIWLPKIRDYLKNNKFINQFDKIWIFDLHEKEIKYKT